VKKIKTYDNIIIYSHYFNFNHNDYLEGINYRSLLNYAGCFKSKRTYFNSFSKLLTEHQET